MPIVCIRRPNRSKPRHFNARAVGRAACAAVKAGESKQLIREEVEACLGARCDSKVRKQLERIKKAADDARGIMDALSLLLDGIAITLKLLEKVPRLKLLLRRLSLAVKRIQIAVKRINQVSERAADVAALLGCDK